MITVTYSSNPTDYRRTINSTVCRNITYGNTRGTTFSRTYNNFNLENLGNLEEIVEIDCGYKTVKELPEDIGKLVNLKHLDIGYSDISFFPESFSNLVNLEHIDYNYNGPESFLDDCGVLVKNGLKSLPESLTRMVLPSVKIFNCSDNLLTSIPENLNTMFPNLELLEISDNRITHIPDNITDMVNLRVLCVDENHMTTIPLSITNCRMLERFYFGGNPIETIPLQVERFCDRTRNRQEYGLGVYNDSQNVHNSTVNNSVKISIGNILNEECISSLDLV